jgi:hypothetical protein
MLALWLRVWGNAHILARYPTPVPTSQAKPGHGAPHFVKRPLYEKSDDLLPSDPRIDGGSLWVLILPMPLPPSSSLAY